MHSFLNGRTTCHNKRQQQATTLCIKLPPCQCASSVQALCGGRSGARGQQRMHAARLASFTRHGPHMEHPQSMQAHQRMTENLAWVGPTWPPSHTDDKMAPCAHSICRPAPRPMREQGLPSSLIFRLRPKIILARPSSPPEHPWSAIQAPTTRNSG